jgi:diguanylate cyclase (GGDEF)-like protein
LTNLRFPIAWRIVAAGTLTFAVGIGFLFLAISEIVDRAVYAQIDAQVSVSQRVLWELVQAKGPPRLVKGMLYLGDWKANNNNSLVDHAKVLTGGDATLLEFVNGRPIRVTTTITKRDGTGRNIGTELTGPARIAIDRGESFSGISPIANQDFVNRYDLLRDGSGRPIGIIYSGIPSKARAATSASIMHVVLIDCFATLAICVALMYFVTLPLRLLFSNTIRVARELARGDVNQVAGVRSNDEVGDINSALAEMIEYQQRMATLADAIAAGDLSTTVCPVAVTDRLGHAFSRMLNNLRGEVERLEHLASTDGLTQLGNVRAYRAEMQIQLSIAGRYDRAISLVLLDIDHFKKINDTLGHQHGDSVLTELATLLHRLRPQDRPYRLGGDEFAVVMPDTGRQEARRALQRLQADVKNHLSGLTLSFGIATCQAGGTSAVDLQRQADIALYMSKANGRNQITVFDGESNAPAATEQT